MTDSKKAGLLRAVWSIIESYWSSHTTKGRIWLTMGVIALIVDAKLCYEYGVTQTTWHGIGFAVVALFFSQLPDGAYEEWTKGNKIAGLFLGLLCLPLGAVAYQSHIGYGAGVRMGDIKKATVQSAKYDGAQEAAKEDKANLEMWTSRLTKLEADNSWIATVTADGLRAQLDAADESIRQEEKRGGCGPKCLSLKKEKGGLQERIAAAEERVSLTKQIEATKRKLDEARALASATDAGMSSVAMQTDANTQLFGVVRAAWTGEKLETALKTTEDSAKLANLLITAAGSLAFMLMAPIGFFMAGRNRSQDHSADVGEYPTNATATSSREIVRTREVIRDDPKALSALDDICNLITNRHTARA